METNLCVNPLSKFIQAAIKNNKITNYEIDKQQCHISINRQTYAIEVHAWHILEVYFSIACFSVQCI